MTRLDRLKALGETFWVKYGDGSEEDRWPADPGRYAVCSFSDRYGESFWEPHGSIEAVVAEVLTGNVEQIVDLDTGLEIGYALKAEVKTPTDQEDWR